MKKHLLSACLLGALALAPTGRAACPEHFSPAAKALLADSIELEKNEHCLNVIYFLGNDNEPVAGYERRLSELLLYLQQFYGKEMARNGFGKRSFGLARRENGDVDILVIRGKRPAATYAYDGDFVHCLKEIGEYFEAHPEQKRSRHSFIIMPTFYNEQYNDGNPGGVPFFGYGVNCFALDYADFDISHLGQETHKGRLLTKWYGGFAHELGHGLNLPHNNGPASMNEALGTPLMNAGNYTFGFSPTYLTPASCNILDRSETFAVAGDKTNFYTSSVALPVAKQARSVYDGEKLTLTFRCEGPCVHVNAYMQEPPYVVNQDYDAVAFAGEMSEPAPDGSREIRFVIPRSELKSLHSDRQQLELLFVGPDGNRSRWKKEFLWSELEKNPEALGMPESFTPERAGY